MSELIYWTSKNKKIDLKLRKTIKEGKKKREDIKKAREWMKWRI